MFATEIAPTKSNGKMSKMATEEQTLHIRSLHQKSEEAIMGSHYNPEVTRLEKQVKTLKKQNNKLVVFSSKFLESANTMETFFFETVNDIRKNIAVRKRIR